MSLWCRHVQLLLDNRPSIVMTALCLSLPDVTSISSAQCRHSKSVKTEGSTQVKAMPVVCICGSVFLGLLDSRLVRAISQNAAPLDNLFL